MAYLRGGSVVDGDLYIEGKLIIEDTTDANGIALPKFESADDAEGAGYIVVLDNDNGNITHVKSISDTKIDSATVADSSDDSGQGIKLDNITYNVAPSGFKYIKPEEN